MQNTTRASLLSPLTNVHHHTPTRVCVRVRHASCPLPYCPFSMFVHVDCSSPPRPLHGISRPVVRVHVALLVPDRLPVSVHSSLQRSRSMIYTRSPIERESFPLTCICQDTLACNHFPTSASCHWCDAGRAILRMESFGLVACSYGTCHVTRRARAHAQGVAWMSGGCGI